MIEFRLPSLGSEMDEGTLLEWKVKPGDHVRKGDVVAVVDTSKSAIDVEIWQEGTVYELAIGLNETVPVGTVIARLLEPGETPEHAEEEKRRLAASAAPAPIVPAPPVAARAVPVSGPATEVAAARQRVSPAARKRASELGVDLAGVAGTGPQGSITREDVEQAAAAKKAPAKDRWTEMRHAIAAAMARSKREIPHYYLATTIDLSHAMAWLAEQNERRPVTERLLPAALLLKATAVAARAVPNVNGFWDGGFQAAPSVHLGVAISLRGGGLVAPAIHDADERSVDEVMAALRDLVERARAGRLRASEMADPTLTVTNLGDQGAEEVLGVIYPPQVAIVGFGRLVERPWAVEEMVGVRPTVRATLAADHRVTDGHEGSRFLSMIERSLDVPEAL